MDFFKINGRAYNVLVTELKESFNILYSDKTGRSVAVGAKMVLDPLGTFYGHSVKVKCRKGYEVEYDTVFYYLSQPRYDGIPV